MTIINMYLVYVFFFNLYIMCLYLLDIRELIHLDDAMEDESLRFGPNGGLVFCME